jgi:ribosomal protein S18 acetylase RimI-like enzyme
MSGRKASEIETRAAILDVMTVRAATLEDVDAILALETATFAQDSLSRRALRRFVVKPERPVLVARSGPRLVGYASLAARAGGRACRIYSIAVDPAYMRRGVGRELVNACDRWARARGLQALRLEVRYDNAPAIGLYQKLGFRQFGCYPAYYADGAQALRYEKELVVKSSASSGS